MDWTFFCSSRFSSLDQIRGLTGVCIWMDQVQHATHWRKATAREPLAANHRSTLVSSDVENGKFKVGHFKSPAK